MLMAEAPSGRLTLSSLMSRRSDLQSRNWVRAGGRRSLWSLGDRLPRSNAISWRRRRALPRRADTRARDSVSDRRHGSLSASSTTRPDQAGHCLMAGVRAGRHHQRSWQLVLVCRLHAAQRSLCQGTWPRSSWCSPSQDPIWSLGSEARFARSQGLSCPCQRPVHRLL